MCLTHKHVNSLTLFQPYPQHSQASVSLQQCLQLSLHFRVIPSRLSLEVESSECGVGGQGFNQGQTPCHIDGIVHQIQISDGSHTLSHSPCDGHCTLTVDVIAEQAQGGE